MSLSLQKKVSKPPRALSTAAAPPAAACPAVRHILHGPRPQTKLTVGAPGDAFEREADQVADQVMRMPEPAVQRMCSHCRKEMEGEGVVRRKCSKCEEEEMHAKEEPGRTPSVPEGFESRFAALQGGGRPLPASERAFFEPRFGRDFSNVRLHSGPAAGELARSVHARAFTLGNSIVLGAGETGRELLAHELTHVVQQGSPDRVQRQTDNSAQLREQLCFGVTGPGPTRCEFTPSQNRKVVFSLFAARGVAGRALQNLGGHDPHLQRLAARIFNVASPDMNALIGTTQRIVAALNLPVRCGTCHDPTCNPAAPGGTGSTTQAAAYVPDDLGSIVICPFFFSLSVMQMRRTILHEAGHAAGIDARPDYQHPTNCPENSSDCIDPCAGISDRLHNVDVWTRFLECAAAAR